MREELALDCEGMLPATECSTRMMALTRAGCEPINLSHTTHVSVSRSPLTPQTSERRQTQGHNSHVQHVGVRELHKQIFVLEHSCRDTNVYFLEDMVVYLKNVYLHNAKTSSGCTIDTPETSYLKRPDLT